MLDDVLFFPTPKITNLHDMIPLVKYRFTKQNYPSTVWYGIKEGNQVTFFDGPGDDYRTNLNNEPGDISGWEIEIA